MAVTLTISAALRLGTAVPHPDTAARVAKRGMGGVTNEFSHSVA